MGALDGRVAVITGAGRGLGREYALLFAREGASVVVNDLGSSSSGEGSDRSPAEMVVAEIEASGGVAIPNTDDVSDESGARGLVAAALDGFGRLDVLINNAGILRDRTIVSMSPGEWDDVVRVHLRGHFLALQAAARYWRDEAKRSGEVSAAVVNTASTSGLLGQFGQSNYAAAKAGIAAMTTIAQLELGRYGVRVNAICPAARTRLTGELEASEAGFDRYDPANVAPFVAYLATESCPIRGKVFFVRGAEVHLFRPWTLVDRIDGGGRWTIEDLQEAGERFADVEFPVGITE